MRSIERHAALLLMLMITVSLCTIHIHEDQYSRKSTNTKPMLEAFLKRNTGTSTSRQVSVSTNETVKTISKQTHTGLHRFDDTCPPLYDAVVPILSAIPKQYIESASSNSSTALFTYNPTIHIYHRDGNAHTGNTSYAATYLASFRVGTLPFLPDPRDYLGLALLDEQLNILNHVVIDINLYVMQQYIAKKRQHKDDGTLFSDFRLVWFNGTYFVTNSIAIIALSIEQTQQELTLPIVCDGGLSVQALSPVRKIRGVERGRNFNWFTLLQEGNERLFLEEWPLPTPRFVGGGRKVSEIIIFDDWRFKAVSSWESLDVPEPSWQGPEQSFRKRNGNICDDRGTACCVPLEREYYHDLIPPLSLNQEAPAYVLIGISHVKSFKRIRMNHGDKYPYLSRFYAFHPGIPPTKIIAQSGLFCWTLRNATAGADGKEQSPGIEWNKQSYECPVIQFPSGISPCATDPSVILVAYGINDVESRIVKVRKRDIAERLFSSMP